MATPHLLLVEDDREISTLLERFLRENELDVSVAPDGRAMDRVLATTRVDLVVLDVMLPGEDGLSLCRRLRASSSMPIIMLTAKGDDIDRIIGLEMGADDYLPKPFNPRELLARVKAVLRRGTQMADAPNAQPSVLIFAGWRLDLARRQLSSPDGARVAVTGAEFDLLQVFCERPGRVLSRDQLIELKQGRAAGPFERSIDVLVSRLRQKIEADPRDPELIKTIRSGGYLFTPPVERE
jgi:two-component system OmpR family response regulator